jgi:outer membrane protein assembly factor BamB
MAGASSSQVYRTAIATAWLAGVFLAAVGATMLYQRFTADSNDPWKSPQLLALKEEMRAAPKDEKIKVRIRELDLKFRQGYVRRLTMVRTGGWLLLGGSIVLVVALTTAMETRKKPPLPLPDHEAGDRALREKTAARRAVAVAGGVLLVAMAGVATGIRTSLTAPGPEVAKGAGAPEAPGGVALPSQAEFLANWPRFRGPTGSGVAALAQAPLQWDGKTGAGIVWKTAVPVSGFNSPIVWGDRLFLSGGTREKREVLCYETAGGKLLWQRAIENVPGSPAKPPEIPDQTGFAAPTMATDGRHAYAIFANGDLAALTFAGAIVWSKNLGVPKNLYGHATSLAVWQGRVLVQYDQGETGPANSRLIAIDGATGRVVWEKPRAMPSSWATPIVVEAAGKTQIITLGVPFLIAYGFADGAELWRAELLEGELTPSPVLAGGLVLAINPSNSLLALRPDGAGDVGATHLRWKAEDDIPDVPSPVSNGELAFTVSSSGNLVCFDLKDGAKVWARELHTEVQASPAIAGNRLYVTGVDGVTLVAEVGRAYKELARNELGEKFVASPAFVQGRIYLRGLDNVYCLGGEAAKPTGP